MPKRLPHAYFEASVFIAILKHEVIDGHERWRHCRGLLKDAEEGKIVAVTSSFTVTEVTGGRRGRPTSEVADQIRGFFENDFVLSVDIDRTIASKAQEHVWDFGLKAPDAIHLASAVAAECDVFYTYDDDLLDIKAKVHSIRIEQPIWHGASQLEMDVASDD